MLLLLNVRKRVEVKVVGERNEGDEGGERNNYSVSVPSALCHVVCLIALPRAACVHLLMRCSGILPPNSTLPSPTGQVIPL